MTAYIVAQVVGAIAAAAVLAVIARGTEGFQFGDGPANAGRPRRDRAGRRRHAQHSVTVPVE